MPKHKISVVKDVKDSRITKDIVDTVKKCAQSLLDYKKVDVPCEVSVMIVDEDRIREINNEQRGIDNPTDVLSFPMLDLHVGELPTAFDVDISLKRVYLGDMVLCIGKIYSQAEEYGHSVEREAGYLTVHSMLHMLGYDHMNDDDKALMRDNEEKALSQIGLLR